MRKQKDVKFIIYQALYIFVVCVIAIKGANLDLDAVEIKKMIEPGYVYIDTSGKVLIDRDRASRLIEIDTARFMIVSIDEYKKNPDKYVGLIKIIPGDINPNPPPTDPNPPQPPVKVDPVKPIKPMVLGKLELFQFHQNTVNNQNDYPITIAGVTIAAHSTGRVMLGGESVVTITGGDQNITANVKPNEKPKINMQIVASMGEDTRVTQLQRSVCYRVTISDDFPGQLDVKFSTGVTVKEVAVKVYDVTMNYFGSKSAFENFKANKEDSPYSVGFTVSVSDNIAGHKITGQNSFSFGEW